jgi:hypothetical protein
MDKTTFTLEIESRQDSIDKFLNFADRRALLGASLRILARRFNDGKKILQDDLIRLAAFADDTPGAAA